MQSDNDTETSNLGTKQFNKRAEHFGKNTMTGDIDTMSVDIATEQFDDYTKHFGEHTKQSDGRTKQFAEYTKQLVKCTEWFGEHTKQFVELEMSNTARKKLFVQAVKIRKKYYLYCISGKALLQ